MEPLNRANGEKSPEANRNPLHDFLAHILHCTVRGAIAVTPNVRPEIVLIELCRVLGVLVGRLYIGELAGVMKFRKACRDAFREGVESVQPIEPKPPAKAETAIPPI